MGDWLLALCVGYGLDLLLGDPAWLYHPVIIIGKFISFAEKKLRARGGNLRRSAVLLTASTVVLTMTVVGVLLWMLSLLGRWPLLIGMALLDWMGLAANAIADLKRRYSKVHLLGHSMGTAMVAILACGDPGIGKIVYVSPSFENLQMSWHARLTLRVLSLFTPKVNCHWHPSSKYHLHYEDAPCDELYLGGEYWTWFFTRQLPEYYKLLKQGLKAIGENAHEHLVICPGRDKIISLPSLELYKEAVGDRQNYVIVENGTHSLFYDKDPRAEESAVEAVISFARTDK